MKIELTFVGQQNGYNIRVWNATKTRHNNFFYPNEHNAGLDRGLLQFEHKFSGSQWATLLNQWDRE